MPQNVTIFTITDTMGNKISITIQTLLVPINDPNRILIIRNFRAPKFHNIYYNGQNGEQKLITIQTLLVPIND